MTCNLGGEERLLVLVTGSREELGSQAKLTYRYCRRCSFVSQDADYSELLEQYARQWDGKSDQELRVYAVQEMAQTWSVVDMVKQFWPNIMDGEGGTMVDVGAGAGGSLVAYRELGWRAVGIEPGLRQGEWARETLNVEMETALYSMMSLPPASVDMIHCYHTLEHMERPYRMLRNFAYHAAPGGMLYVETPNVRDTGRSHLNFEHVSMFSPSTLAGAIRACGFDIVRVVHRRVDSEPGVFTAGVGVLALRRPHGEQPMIDAEVDCIPPALISWRKDSFLKLKIGLHYALFTGQPRPSGPLALRTVDTLARMYVTNPRLKRLARAAADRWDPRRRR